MSQAVKNAQNTPTRLDEVEGWFWAVDQLMFDWFLERQHSNPGPGRRGDLLELGAYLGKSAIFLGQYLRDDETFTVCDLFGADAPDASNMAETTGSYASLTRPAFEANYLSFHDTLPVIIQAPTSVVTERVAAGSCRFVHIDASHLYEHVRGDIAASRAVAAPGAVVAFDDYRSEHCPGVAAAIWGAVASQGLHVLAVTGNKLYATWDDPEPLRTSLEAWAAGREDLELYVEEVAGEPLIRIAGANAVAPALPVSRHAAAEPPAAASAPAPAPVPGAAAPRPLPARWRKLGKDLLPPVLTRAIVRRRHRPRRPAPPRS
ncbi:class I SAM-dependent methyltransferase [Streptomyces sp. NPDC090022]|uniref:class I SAM-dependent methyltransferase n=1 Tax=Streptomyces sp. NPDC090022 TaxID=3365920 RepID=UPI0037FE4B5A